MNETQRGIINLLKSSLTQKPCTLPEGFSMDEAMQEINRHKVAPLCYDGAIISGLPKESPEMQQLFRHYCLALMVSERQMCQVERVCAAFDEQGIDYMPLKGCRMKALYPRPELRTMGDADILVRVEQRGQIERIMPQLGFDNPDNSDHEMIWRSPSLYLELHKRLIPSYNKDFYTRIGDGWKLAKLKDGSRHSMTAEDEFVYLFTHFAKHYRDSGIGCRHVADLWVFLHSYPKLDETAVCAGLDELGLLEFYGNMRRVLSLWFDDGPEDEKSELISDYIFKSGNFGSLGTRALSKGVQEIKKGNNTKGTKLSYFLHILFPSRDAIKDRYRILEHHPWALPLVWLYRPLYKLLFDRKALKNQKQIISAMDRDKIDEHQQLLNYVGLDYNF